MDSFFIGFIELTSQVPTLAFLAHKMSGKTISLDDIRRASASARAPKSKTYSSKNHGLSGPNIMSMVTALAALTMVPPVAKPTLVQEEDLAHITAINGKITILHMQKKDLSAKIEAAKKTCDATAKAVAVALRDLNSATDAFRAHKAMTAPFVPFSSSVNRASGIIVPRAPSLLRLPVNLLFAAVSLAVTPIDMARTAIARTSGSLQIYNKNRQLANDKHTAASLVHQSSLDCLAALQTELDKIIQDLAARSSELDSIIERRPTPSPSPASTPCPAMCGGGGSAPAAAAAPSPFADVELSADLHELFGDH